MFGIRDAPVRGERAKQAVYFGVRDVQAAEVVFAHRDAATAHAGDFGAKDIDNELVARIGGLHDKESSDSWRTRSGSPIRPA